MGAQPLPYTPNPQLPVTHPQALQSVLGGNAFEGMPAPAQQPLAPPTIPSLADPLVREKLVQYVRGRKSLEQFFTRNAVSRSMDKGRVTRFIRVDPKGATDGHADVRQWEETGTVARGQGLYTPRSVYVPVFEGESDDQAYRRHLQLVSQWRDMEATGRTTLYGLEQAGNNLTFGFLRKVWPGLDKNMREVEQRAPIQEMVTEGPAGAGEPLSLMLWNKAPTGWLFRGVEKGATGALRWGAEKALTTRAGAAAARSLESSYTGARSYLASRLSGKLNTVSAWTFKNVDSAMRRVGGRMTVAGDTIRVHVARGSSEATLAELKTAWRAFRSEAAQGGLAPKIELVRNAPPILGNPGIGPALNKVLQGASLTTAAAATAGAYAAPSILLPENDAERQAGLNALPGLLGQGAAFGGALWLGGNLASAAGFARQQLGNRTYEPRPGSNSAGTDPSAGPRPWRGPSIGPPPPVGPRYPALSASRLPEIVAPNLPEVPEGPALPLRDQFGGLRQGLQETLRTLSDGREVERITNTYRGLASEQETAMRTALASKIPPKIVAGALRQQGVALRERVTLLNELAGKDRGPANALLGGFLDDLLFTPSLGVDPVLSKTQSQLARWAQGVAEQATRRGLPITEMLRTAPPPQASIDLPSMIGRIQLIAEAVTARDPSAPVAPPEELLPQRPPTLAQAQPVQITPPVALPHTIDQIDGPEQLPPAAEIAKNPALTTLHLEYAQRASHGQPFEIGHLVPNRTLALGDEEPAQIPISFDDGRLFAHVPQPSGNGVMPVDITGVDVVNELRLTPEADWRVQPGRLAPVAFNLDTATSRLVVDPEGTTKRAWLSQLFKQQALGEWTDGFGTHPHTSPVSLLNTIAEAPPRTPEIWRQVADVADSMLEAHRAKAPSIEDAARLNPTDSAGEHAAMTREWFAVGSVLETARHLADKGQQKHKYSAKPPELFRKGVVNPTLPGRWARLVPHALEEAGTLHVVHSIRADSPLSLDDLTTQYKRVLFDQLPKLRGEIELLGKTAPYGVQQGALIDQLSKLTGEAELLEKTALPADLRGALLTIFWASGFPYYHAALAEKHLIANGITPESIAAIPYEGPYDPLVRLLLNSLATQHESITPEIFGPKLAPVFRQLRGDNEIVWSRWLERMAARVTGLYSIRYREARYGNGALIPLDKVEKLDPTTEEPTLRIPSLNNSRVIDDKIYTPDISVAQPDWIQPFFERLHAAFPGRSYLELQQAVERVEAGIYKHIDAVPSLASFHEQDELVQSFVAPGMPFNLAYDGPQHDNVWIDLDPELKRTERERDFLNAADSMVNAPLPAEALLGMPVDQLPSFIPDEPVAPSLAFRENATEKDKAVATDLFTQIRAWHDGVIEEPTLDQGDIRTLQIAHRPWVQSNGVINFIGTKVEGPDDIAALGKVLRNAQIELGSAWIVNKQTNEIIGHEVWTSNLPGSVAGTVDSLRIPDFVARLNALQEKVGAPVGFWFMHNHPSAQVDPSSGDRAHHAAQKKAYGSFFLGDIIIDHGKFSVAPVEDFEPYGHWTTKQAVQAGPDPLKGTALGRSMPTLRTESDIAQEMMSIVNDPKTAALIYFSGFGTVAAVQLVPIRRLEIWARQNTLSYQLHELRDLFKAESVALYTNHDLRDGDDASKVLDFQLMHAVFRNDLLDHVIGRPGREAGSRAGGTSKRWAEMHYARMDEGGGREILSLAAPPPPDLRAEALEHAASGQGWSRGRGPKLFQALTDEEKFKAVLANIQAGAIRSRSHLDKLNPSRWTALQKFPAYFETWRPTRTQLVVLRAAWTDRSAKFDRTSRGIERIKAYVQKRTGKPSAPTKPLLDRETIAQITPDMLDDLLRTDPRAFDELRKQFFTQHDLRSEDVVAWDRAQEAIRAATEERLRELETKNPLRKAHAGSGIRLVRDRSRANMTAISETMKMWFGRPSLILGWRKQAPTPAEYKRLLDTGDIKRSVFHLGYTAQLQKQKGIRTDFAEFEILSDAAQASPALDTAIFDLLNTFSMDELSTLPIDVAIPAAKRYHKVRLGARTVTIDLHEWMPKLRRKYDELIENIQRSVAEEALIDKSRIRAAMRGIDAELQRRELAVALRYARENGLPEPTAWSAIPPEMLQIVRSGLTKHDKGDPKAEVDSPAYRSYRGLRQSLAARAKKYEEKNDLYVRAKSGGFRGQSYVTHLYDTTFDDVRDALQDPYGPYALYSRPDIRTAYLEKRKGEGSPIPSWVASWFLYVPAMHHRTHLGPALKMIEPKIPQLPNAMRMYALEWVRSLKGAQTPMDSMMNGIISRAVGKHFDQWSDKPFTQFTQGLTRFGYYTLLNPVKTGLLTVSETAFFARELARGGLRDLFNPTRAPWWLLRGGIEALKNGTLEIANAAKRAAQPELPRWYSEPTLMGVTETVHELLQPHRGSPLAPEPMLISKLLTDLGKAVFSPIGATEFLLRSWTYETLKRRALEEEGLPEDEAMILAANQTSDLIGAYGKSDTNPHLRGSLARSLIFLRRFAMNKTELFTSDVSNTIASRGRATDWPAQGATPPPPPPPDVPGSKWSGWADPEEESAFKRYSEPVGQVGIESEVAWQARKANTWAALMWIPSFLICIAILGAVWGADGAVSMAWPFVTGLSELPSLANADEFLTALTYPMKKLADAALPGESISPFEERRAKAAYKNLIHRIPWGIGPLVRLKEWYDPPDPKIPGGLINMDPTKGPRMPSLRGPRMPRLGDPLTVPGQQPESTIESLWDRIMKDDSSQEPPPAE